MGGMKHPRAVFSRCLPAYPDAFRRSCATRVWARWGMVWVAGALACHLLLAVTPAAPEFAAAQRWLERNLGPLSPQLSLVHLEVVHEDAADGVSFGQSWRGTPFQIADRTFRHGVAFNATKHLRVRLDRPGARFVAHVGLENNDDTRRGAQSHQGSVTFHVWVAGREVVSTPVLRLTNNAVLVDVPLQGASEFELRVQDGGDGRGWDQALWGEAEVVLASGEHLRLQDGVWAGAPAHHPFTVSFRYGGQSSDELLGHWERQVTNRTRDQRSSERTITYRDPASQLEVRIEATLFQDFPAVEWVAYLRNRGQQDSPLLEDIQAAEGVLPLPAGGAPVLHWARGGVASFDDFAPQAAPLAPHKPVRLHAGGGRGSSEVLPFFNLAAGSEGVIAAIGWSGEWAAEFQMDARNQVRWRAGMARTRLILHPGEEVRTPRILLLPYQGDRWRGQNLLRQFVLQHHRPNLNGKPLRAPITCGNWGATRAEVHLDNIRKINEHQLPLDYYWIDAEWYGANGSPGSWAVNVGDWRYKTNLYPAGFKPLSEALRAAGRELMLWFEPERVFRGTPWHRDHPEWLLDQGHDSALLNLGHPAARQFVTDFISARIQEFGLGCYRQDFNIEPLSFWQKADAPDRQGIAEIRYIEGLYAFWDGLLARHPGLIIDNCASGGRRIELETLGRATPFWRSDGPRDPIAHQCHTYGLMLWAPLSATSQDRAGDDYEFRSSMCSSLCLNWWVSGDAPAERIPDTFPFAWARRTLDQYVEYRDLFAGDFYPLTEYSQGRDVWMSYQLDDPRSGRGLVVALRRPDSPYETARFALHELQAEARYEVRNLDAGTTRAWTGRQLMEGGLEVQLPQRPGSGLFHYERK